MSQGTDLGSRKLFREIFFLGKISNIPLKLEKFSDLPNHISYLQIYPPLWGSPDFPLFCPTSPSLSILRLYSNTAFPSFFSGLLCSNGSLSWAPSPSICGQCEIRQFFSSRHTCTRAALLDVYEFVPEKVDSRPFTQPQSLKRTCGKFVRQFKFILVTESFTMDTPTLMKSLLRQKFSPKSVPIRRLNPRRSKTISKTFTASKISYQKAYRARDRARQIIDGSHKETYVYSLLPLPT